MPTQPIHLALDELEQALRTLALWQETPPSAEALASEMPFCLDTLAFHEWLQFILLDRFRQMLRREAMMPAEMALYPMATEVYKSSLAEHALLLQALARLDEAVTGRPVVREG